MLTTCVMAHLKLVVQLPQNTQQSVFDNNILYGNYLLFGFFESYTEIGDIIYSLKIVSPSHKIIGYWSGNVAVISVVQLTDCLENK